MQERTRQRLTRPGPGPGGDLFDVPDPAPDAGLVVVSHGTFAETLPVAGMSVGQVRSRFRDRLDIHPQALALLGGRPVDDDTRVEPGQMLNFVRPAGEKGGSRCRRAA